jgi:hypothetical protein
MTSMNLVNEQSGEKHIMTHERWKNTRRQDADEREPVVPEREPGDRPDGEPGNEPFPPDADRSPGRREGPVSDPDFQGPGNEAAAMVASVPNWRPGNGRLTRHVSPGRCQGVVSDPDY